MKVAPWWFQTLAAIFAIVLSLWAGLHFRSTEWLVLYLVAAVLSAVLPIHRTVGLVGLLVALAITAWGVYELRGVWSVLQMSDLWEYGGSLVSAAREVVMIVLTGTWLILGSAFRALRA